MYISHERQGYDVLRISKKMCPLLLSAWMHRCSRLSLRDFFKTIRTPRSCPCAKANTASVFAFTSIVSGKAPVHHVPHAWGPYQRFESVGMPVLVEAIIGRPFTVSLSTPTMTGCEGAGAATHSRGRGAAKPVPHAACSPPLSASSFFISRSQFL